MYTPYVVLMQTRFEVANITVTTSQAEVGRRGTDNTVGKHLNYRQWMKPERG